MAIHRPARKGESYFCLYQIDGNSWSESIPEGRYPDTKITAFMAKVPDVPLLRDGKDIQASPIAVARVALRQEPTTSWPRGEGLQARHYSVGFRQSPVST